MRMLLSCPEALAVDTNRSLGLIVAPLSHWADFPGLGAIISPPPFFFSLFRAIIRQDGVQV